MRGDRRYLAQDEEIVLRVRRHPAVLFATILQTVAIVLAALVIGFAFSPRQTGDLVDTLVGLAALAMVARLAWRLWVWRADRIVVTDKRIFEVSGVLTRKVASMPLVKMTDITYRRSVLGRLLGYGELIVETAGQDQSLNRITHLPQPDDFYRTITWLVTGGLTPKAEPDWVDDDDTGPLPRVVV